MCEITKIFEDLTLLWTDDVICILINPIMLEHVKPNGFLQDSRQKSYFLKKSSFHDFLTVKKLSLLNFRLFLLLGQFSTLLWELQAGESGNSAMKEQRFLYWFTLSSFFWTGCGLWLLLVWDHCSVQSLTLSFCRSLSFWLDSCSSELTNLLDHCLCLTSFTSATFSFSAVTFTSSTTEKLQKL